LNINTSSSDDGGAACRIIDIKTGNLVTVYKNIDGSVIGWNRQKNVGGKKYSVEIPKNMVKTLKKVTEETNKKTEEENWEEGGKNENSEGTAD